jgi:predicted Zn-ribbon and HTH transcriptional regulator
MPTIVTYTDREPAINQYPQRIVSPSQPKPCCFSDMEEIGAALQDERWVFQYRRCRQCGFTVRVILRELPDTALAEELRQILATAFVRNVPDL